MKKTLLTLIATSTIVITTIAQNVNIPDANFKAKLLANNAINTDNNKSEISVSEAIAFNGFIDVKYSNIASLVGIEAFINLKELSCLSNQLTNLDVTKNTALTRLTCSSNNLTSLDVTKNTALTELWCYNNQLTSLDLTKNTALIILECSLNQLISIDVMRNTALEGLYLSDNQLTSVDVTKNTALTGFTCSSNNLLSLDVTINTNLTELSCSLNPNLICIQALNTQIKTNWEKDDIANYNENCNYITSINNEIISQPKTISTIYNLQGQVVNTTYQGLVIIRYTDGTSEKVLQ